MSSGPRAAAVGPTGMSRYMQSADRNVFKESQSRAERAFHMPRTVSSTDTCELRFVSGNCGSLVRGAQEAAGAVPADKIGRLAVEEHRAAADENRGDGVVVAVDHPGQPAVLLDRVLGVAIESRIELFRVDHDDVSAVADAQVAGVDAIPVGELTGQSVHGLLDGHERLAGLLGVVHVPE